MHPKRTLIYYLASTLGGSILIALIAFLAVNLPDGTRHTDELSIVFLMSCGFAGIGSLPYLFWLQRHIRNKKTSVDFSLVSILKFYWRSSSVYALVLPLFFLGAVGLNYTLQGGAFTGTNFTQSLAAPVLLWLSYVPLGAKVLSILVSSEIADDKPAE